ncbi:MAG: hypothetical protein AAFR44_13605 [Pseudomonadota bacterium]
MQSESAWLGRLRQPVRLAAIGFTALTVVLWAWLILGQFTAEMPVDMMQMLRPDPANTTAVAAMYVALSDVALRKARVLYWPATSPRQTLV